jgi:hypothetical protein
VGSSPTPGIRIAVHSYANVCSLQELRRVEALVDLGLNDCAIARLAGIPRTTVRDWRRSTRWRGKGDGALELRSCTRCGHPAHAFHELGGRYAYLLGLYLGDGYVVHHKRGVYRLTISLDAKYPGIVSECRHAIEATMPSGRVASSFAMEARARGSSTARSNGPASYPSTGRVRSTNA